MRPSIPLLAAACLLVACGDDGGSAGPATTSATATTTTTAAPASTTSTATTSTTATTAAAPACPGTEAPRAAADVDGDGTDEVWRHAGTGASVDILELRVVDGCDEVPVAQFPVGGSVRQLHGVRCEAGQVVELRATSADGEAYATTEVTFELAGTELVEVGRVTGQLPGGAPELAAYSGFAC